MSQDEESRERAARRIAALLEEPERHLDFESELAPYVDGTLDEAGREIVDSHAEDCAMCRAELEDLQDAVTPRVPRKFLGVPLSSSAGPRQFLGTTPRNPEEPRGTEEPFALRIALPIAAAIVVGVTALLMLRSNEQPQVVPQPQPQPRISIPVRPTKPPPPAPDPSPPPRTYARKEWAALVARALESGRLPVSPALAALRPSGADSLRGETLQKHARLTPTGIVVDSVRPRFTWTPDDAASYVVSIFAGDEEVATSRTIKTAQWQPDRELRRGRTYTWQVEVIRNGVTVVLPQPPAAPALFRILGHREHEEIEEARRTHPDDALLLAALYARHGLMADADAELSKLSHSTDARVQRLLRARQNAGDPTSTNDAQ